MNGLKSLSFVIPRVSIDEKEIGTEDQCVLVVVWLCTFGELLILMKSDDEICAGKKQQYIIDVSKNEIVYKFVVGEYCGVVSDHLNKPFGKLKGTLHRFKGLELL